MIKKSHGLRNRVAGTRKAAGDRNAGAVESDAARQEREFSEKSVKLSGCAGWKREDSISLLRALHEISKPYLDGRMDGDCKWSVALRTPEMYVVSFDINIGRKNGGLG